MVPATVARFYPAACFFPEAQGVHLESDQAVAFFRPASPWKLKSRKPPKGGFLLLLAEWTGLEPATPGVTGRYSNQLNYHSLFTALAPDLFNQLRFKTWRPHGDSNPGTYRERVMS